MNQLIPDELVGKNTQLSSEHTCDTIEEAREKFREAQQRLLTPNNWGEFAGGVSADFKLFGKDGKPSSARPEEGDRLRIKIPGPGSDTGDGFDWVEISLIETGETADGEYTGMKVRPTDNPQTEKDDTAHFLEDTSTSTFLVHRKGAVVTAAYYGRNEIINSGAGTVVDKIRNTIVGIGAFLGFSEVQWKALVKGFLDPAK